MTNTAFTVRYNNKDIMDKLDTMDGKIDKVHTQVAVTNGSVRFHTKLIWGAYGFTFAVLMIGLRILTG